MPLELDASFGIGVVGEHHCPLRAKGSIARFGQDHSPIGDLAFHVRNDLRGEKPCINWAAPGQYAGICMRVSGKAASERPRASFRVGDATAEHVHEAKGHGICSGELPVSKIERTGVRRADGHR